MRLPRLKVVPFLLIAVGLLLASVTVALAGRSRRRVPETRPNGKVALKMDRDCDGLSNRAERRLGTNLRITDSDADGLTDGEEVLQADSDPTEGDTDGDGIDDGDDDCPAVVDPDQPDNDADGIGDACDSNGGIGDDGDGVFEDDNCPDVANPTQRDTDGDEIGDVCDQCPAVADPDESDNDADGVGDACGSNGESGEAE